MIKWNRSATVNWFWRPNQTGKILSGSAIIIIVRINCCTITLFIQYRLKGLYLIVKSPDLIGVKMLSKDKFYHLP
jgi:hypothetical protein